MKEIRRKFTYANVMSSLAVFMVLGGATAVAATHLGRNSVGTAQLKANAVTARKIADGAVTGGVIRDGSVTGSDIAPGSVTGSDIKLDTLPAVPEAQSVAGQTSFSVYVPTGSEKQAAAFGPFSLLGVCNANGPRAELDITGTRSAEAVRSGTVPPIALEVGPVHSILTSALGSTPPAIQVEGAEWIVRDPTDQLAFSISHVALGVGLSGHSGECFFSGSVETLGT